MDKKYNLLYIGLHPQTPDYLFREKRFKLLAVVFLDYFDVLTPNPISWLFRVIYNLRAKERFRFLELFFLYLYYPLRFLSSGVFKKYCHYLYLLSREKIAIIDINNESSLIKYITDKNIDIIVVNSWDIISDKIFSAPKFGTINIHPSKLPKYRGALPTLWALRNGDEKTAVTFIILNNGVDTGKIISQREFDISKNDNAIDIEHKIDNILENFLNNDLINYLDGKLMPYAQDDQIPAYITAKYEAYKLIDWENERAVDIYNKITAYPYIEPSVYCYFYLGEKKIELKKAELSKFLIDMKSKKFIIRGLEVFFQTKDDIIKSRLFLDIGFWDSWRIIWAGQR